MKKLLLPILLLIGNLTFGQDLLSTLTFQEAKQKAKIENKKIFVFAGLSYVGPVRYMKKNILTDAAVIEAFNKKYISIEIDLEDEAQADFVKQFKLDAAPAMLFLDSEGKELGRLIGALEVDALLKAQADF